MTELYSSPINLARFELEKRYNLDSDVDSDLCSNGSDEDENEDNGELALSVSLSSKSYILTLPLFR